MGVVDEMTTGGGVVVVRNSSFFQVFFPKSFFTGRLERKHFYKWWQFDPSLT